MGPTAVLLLSCPDQPGVVAAVADPFGMDVTIRFAQDRPRVALLASRAPHCLVDLLSRWHAGETAAEVALVASNHTDHAELCAFFGVPFEHVPAGDDPTEQLDEGPIIAQAVAHITHRVLPWGNRTVVFE